MLLTVLHILHAMRISIGLARGIAASSQGRGRHELERRDPHPEQALPPFAGWGGSIPGRSVSMRDQGQCALHSVRTQSTGEHLWCKVQGLTLQQHPLDTGSAP